MRPSAQAPAALVSGALFIGGCLAFAWGFLVAIERSRTEEIELSSLFFLKESAPAKVRQALLGLMTAQVVVAIVTASVRPFTSLAFGVLAPVWGLGIITLWSGRHGVFPAKSIVSRHLVHLTEADEAEESSDATTHGPSGDSGANGAGRSAASATTDEDRPE